MILLRRHQEEGRRAGPRGRPELSTSVLVKQSETILISLGVDNTDDILLLGLSGPNAISKRDLLSRYTPSTEVSRGDRDALIKAGNGPAKSLNPIILRPSKDFRHRACQGGKVGRRGPSPNRPRGQPPLLER